MPAFDIDTLLQLNAVINVTAALVWCLLAAVFRVAPGAAWLLAGAHFCVLLTSPCASCDVATFALPGWMHRVAAVLSVTLLALGLRRLLRLQTRTLDIALVGTAAILLTLLFGLRGETRIMLAASTAGVSLLSLLCCRDVALGLGPSRNSAATLALMLPYLVLAAFSGARALALSGVWQAPVIDPQGRLGALAAWLWMLVCLAVPISLVAVVIRRLILRIEHLTLRDPLTGLFNRRAITAELARLARQQQRQRSFSVLMIDVDHFKRINDAHGHSAGDAALCHLAGVLRRCTREGDVLGRLGGEEFCALLPRTDLAAACRVAERMRTHLDAETLVWRGLPIAMSASIGVAGGRPNDPDGQATLAAADAQLYRAKAQGRNRVCAAPQLVPAPPAPDADIALGDA